MEFCDDCESILFLKSIPRDEDTESKLIYNCKICGFKKDTKPEDTRIYSHDYSGDYLSYKIITNPNICLDPTLPILNNVDCANEKCIVNLHEDKFKNIIHIKPVLFNNRKKIMESIEDTLKLECVKEGFIENINQYSISTDQENLLLKYGLKVNIVPREYPSGIFSPISYL